MSDVEFISMRSVRSLSAHLVLILVVCFSPLSAAQVSVEAPLRLGIILPLPIPGATVSNIYGPAAEAALRGAQLAVEHGQAKMGLPVRAYVANSPSPEVAYRAAQRLFEVSDVHILIGGVGAGQADAITDAANDAGLLFFNIGDSSEALRNCCNEKVFHIEAGEVQYLRAIIQAYSEYSGVWALVHSTSERGQRLRQLADQLLQNDPAIPPPLWIVVDDAATVFPAEVRKLAEEEPAVVLVLLEGLQQEMLLWQLEQAGFNGAVTALNGAAVQTRTALAASRDTAPSLAGHPRVALWDAAIEAGAGGQFNFDYIARFGSVPEPTAWASYQAVRLVLLAFQQRGTDVGEISDYLRSKGDLDIFKEDSGCFSANGQLEQSLYSLRLDPEASWNLSPTQLLKLVSSIEHIPVEITTSSGFQCLN